METRNYDFQSGSKEQQALFSLPFVLVGSFLSIFDQFVINVAATSISHALQPSAAELEGIVSGYALVYALGLITGGRIGDKYGRQKIYRIGLLMFTITSALCGISQTSEQLVVARLLQGISGAVMVPQVLALIRVTFEGTARVRALSLFGVSIGMGQIWGQLLGGLIPSWNLFGLGWRPIFLLNIPVCLIAFFICGRTVPKDRGNKAEKLDLTGVELSSIGCALVLIPLLGERDTPWMPWGILSMAVGAAVLAVFSRQQSRKAEAGQIPLIPFKLFYHRGYTLGVVLNIMLYLAIIPFFFVLGLYLQNVCGLSSWSAGLTFSPIGIGFIIGSSVGSEIIRKITAQRTLILGTACTTVGLSAVLICVIVGPPVVTPFVIGSLLIFGFGNGTTLPIVTGVVMRYLPVNEAGAGSAVLTTGQQLFGAIGVAITGMIVLIGSNPPTLAGAYAGGLAAQALSALASLICAFLLKRIAEEER